MRRPDIRDSTLVVLVLGAAAVLVPYFAFVQPALPIEWRRPGSAPLYLSGVIGTALLFVSVLFVLAKRGGRSGAAPGWFVAHVLAGTAGTTLVAIHSAGFLRRPPALLFLALAALVALGIWARVSASHRMAATFGTKRRAYAAPGAHVRESIAALIREKRALLPSIDPQAAEGTFSPTLGHWLHAPGACWRYARLVRAENGLIGARRSVGFPQAWWRPVHLALAGLFILGALVHVLTVTFFAGYVAGGGPITWWHLADW